MNILIQLTILHFILIWGSIILYIECSKRSKNINSYGVVEKDTPQKTFANQEEIDNVRMYEGLLEEYCILLEELERLSEVPVEQSFSPDLNEVKTVEKVVSSVPSDVVVYEGGVFDDGGGFDARIALLQDELEEYSNEPSTFNMQGLSEEEVRAFDRMAFDGASPYPEAGTEVITDEYERLLEERGR